jgi:putative proteasome-type protease
MIRNSWGQQLKAVFEGIEAPVWDINAASNLTGHHSSASANNVHCKPVMVRIRIKPQAIHNGKPAILRGTTQQSASALIS